jgi:hypothetical protein
MHMPRHACTRKRLFLLTSLAVALAGGCSPLVPLTDAGAAVRLATPEAVSGCTLLGRTTASVVHQVAFIPRHPDAVRDNINVTARNSAAGMGGDSVVPASPIENGKQAFDVYRCTRR